MDHELVECRAAFRNNEQPHGLAPRRECLFDGPPATDKLFVLCEELARVDRLGALRTLRERTRRAALITRRPIAAPFWSRPTRAVEPTIVSRTILAGAVLPWTIFARAVEAAILLWTILRRTIEAPIFTRAFVGAPILVRALAWPTFLPWPVLARRSVEGRPGPVERWPLPVERWPIVAPRPRLEGPAGLRTVLPRAVVWSVVRAVEGRAV
jgi:hypothetical protein